MSEEPEGARLTNESLVARLYALERRQRFTIAAGVTLVIVVGALTLLGAQSPEAPATPKRIEAEEFILRDPSGRPRRASRSAASRPS